MFNLEKELEDVHTKEMQDAKRQYEQQIADLKDQSKEFSEQLQAENQSLR